MRACEFAGRFGSCASACYVTIREPTRHTAGRNQAQFLPAEAFVRGPRPTCTGTDLRAVRVCFSLRRHGSYLRVPRAACHVPPVYMWEAANTNLAPEPANGNAETLTCPLAFVPELPGNRVRACLGFRRPLRSHRWLCDGPQAGITRVTWQFYGSESCAAVDLSARETTDNANMRRNCGRGSWSAVQHTPSCSICRRYRAK